MILCCSVLHPNNADVLQQCFHKNRRGSLWTEREVVIERNVRTRYSAGNKCLLFSINSEINAGSRSVNVSNLMRPAVNVRGISRLLIPRSAGPGSYIRRHNDRKISSNLSGSPRLIVGPKVSAHHALWIAADDDLRLHATMMCQKSLEYVRSNVPRIRVWKLKSFKFFSRQKILGPLRLYRNNPLVW